MSTDLEAVEELLEGLLHHVPPTETIVVFWKDGNVEGASLPEGTAIADLVLTVPGPCQAIGTAHLGWARPMEGAADSWGIVEPVMVRSVYVASLTVTRSVIVRSDTGEVIEIPVAATGAVGDAIAAKLNER